MNLVRYSCHIGDYDRIGEHNKDLTVFTDGEGGDNTTKSRYYKINSHLIGDHDVSLYQDMCVEWLRPYEKFLEYLTDDVDLVAFDHWNTSIIEEGEHCKSYYIDLDEWVKIYHRYQTDGFEDDIGFVDGSVILRRNNEKVKKFNEIWWENFYKRDQLSMMYAIWKSGVKFKAVPEQSEWRIRHKHLNE